VEQLAEGICHQHQRADQLEDNPDECGCSFDDQRVRAPVPKDLVPILAKDRLKQEAIMQRALQQGDDKATPKVTTPPTEQQPPTRGAGPSGPWLG
jgi:hypothetical protein